MKTKHFMVFLSVMSCLVWVHGALAETAGYKDSTHNGVTGSGVLGAQDTGNGTAVSGISSDGIGGIFVTQGTSGIGVEGAAMADSGKTYGGHFYNASSSGVAVYGIAEADSGKTYGGQFESNSSRGTGVYGLATAASGETKGGSFDSWSSTGRGAYGLASSTEGVNYGVYGETKSPSGFGVYSNGKMKVEGKFTCTGRVGIGTDTPKGKLDVNGAIYQRGNILHADYVFDNNYKLESIDEHSNFMWENKHLKAIPKAQTDENGLEIVEVGAHQKGIVEELEKAHIYIQQLNAKNRELEDRILKLEASLTNKTQ